GRYFVRGIRCCGDGARHQVPPGILAEPWQPGIVKPPQNVAVQNQWSNYTKKLTNDIPLIWFACGAIRLMVFQQFPEEPQRNELAASNARARERVRSPFCEMKWCR
ncbi:MAG: hypothetical protein AAF293_05130, partial [Pseudomonadota bacterium]